MSKKPPSLSYFPPLCPRKICLPLFLLIPFVREGQEGCINGSRVYWGVCVCVRMHLCLCASVRGCICVHVNIHAHKSRCASRLLESFWAMWQSIHLFCFISPLGVYMATGLKMSCSLPSWTHFLLGPWASSCFWSTLLAFWVQCDKGLGMCQISLLQNDCTLSFECILPLNETFSGKLQGGVVDNVTAWWRIGAQGVWEGVPALGASSSMLSAMRL